MIYLLYGLDSYSKRKKLDDIIVSIDKNSVARYNFLETNLDFIIDYCATDSLLSEKQAIIIDNCNYFTSKFNEEFDFSRFEAYLKNYNPNTILIFYLEDEKIDNRKKATKLVDKDGVILNFEPKSNLTEQAKNLFAGYNISNNDLSYFLEITGNNLGIIENEINKLKSYKDNNEHISKQDIDLVVLKNEQPDIFALVDAIVNKNVPEALKLYRTLLLYNEEPVKVIVLVANQLRLIYQTKKLFEMGYDISSIAKKLAVHPYRVKLAHQVGNQFKQNNLLMLLNKLANIDIEIKSGLVKKEIAFELFILSL